VLPTYGAITTPAKVCEACPATIAFSSTILRVNNLECTKQHLPKESYILENNALLGKCPWNMSGKPIVLNIPVKVGN
jgi:hypothetical protein